MERDDTRGYRVEGEQVDVWMETHYLYFTDWGGWRWSSPARPTKRPVSMDFHGGRR